MDEWIGEFPATKVDEHPPSFGLAGGGGKRRY